MLISELEAHLKELREKHGDLPVFYIEEEYNERSSYIFPVTVIEAVATKKHKHFRTIPAQGSIDAITIA